METIFEGYLFKSPPQITKKWRKRYFVLFASKKLLYYTDPNGTYKGTIDLTYCQEVEYDVYFEKAEYRNALSIKLSNAEASSNKARDTNRVFYLLASSRQLMDTWYQHLIDVAELKMDSKQEHNVITNNILPQDCYVSARRQVNSDKTKDKVSYNPNNDSFISSNEFVDLGAYSLGGRTLSEVSQLEIAADDDNSSSDDETEAPSLPPLPIIPFPKPNNNNNNNRKSCIQDYSSVKYSFTSETSIDSGYSPTTVLPPRQAEIIESNSPDDVPPFNNPPRLPSGNQPPSNPSTNQLSYTRSVPLTSNFPPVPLPRANQLPPIPSSNNPPLMPATNYPLPMPPICNSLPISPSSNPPPMPPTNNPPPMLPTNNPPPMPPTCNSLPILPTNNPPPMPPTSNPPPMPPTSIPPPMRPNDSNTPPRRPNSGNPLPKSPTTNPLPMSPTTNPPPMPPTTNPPPMSPTTNPPPMSPTTYPPPMPPTTNPPPMPPTTNPPPMPPTTNPPPMPPTTNPLPMPPTSSNHPPLPYPPNSNNSNYNNNLSEIKQSCPPVPKHRDLNIDLPLDANNNNNNNSNNNPRPPKRFDSQKKHKVAKCLSQDNKSNNNLKNNDNNNDNNGNNNTNNNNNNNNNNKFLNSKFRAKSLKNINYIKSGINPHSKSTKVSQSVTEESSGLKNNYVTITHHHTALPTNDLPPHLDMPSPVSISPYSVVVRKSESLIEEEHIYTNEQDGSAEQMYMNGNPDTGMYIRFDPAPSTLDLQSDGGYVSIRSKGARILEDDGGITVDVGGYVKVTSAGNNNNNNDIQENPYTSVKSNLIK